MTTIFIKSSIQKEKIQLNFWQTLAHNRLSIILMILAFFSFTNGFQNIPTFKSDIIYNKFGFIFFMLSAISFFYQQSRLRLISLETDESPPNIIKKIIELSNHKAWDIEMCTEDALIIKTNRPLSLGRYFISKSHGEKIFVFLKPNKVLIRSIFDYERSYNFIISCGENNENEKNILREITSEHIVCKTNTENLC